MECAAVGATNADIAGLGIILSFAIQAFISLILSIWSFSLRDVLERDADIDEISKRRYRKMRRRIDAVLASISDAQTITGIALLLSALIQRNTLELYHFHIIYDTINFTAVSFCAAIVCSFTHEDEQHLSRFLSIFLFSILYLTFVISFGINLAQWDWEASGSCYNPAKIAESNASHPYVDKIYLSITCFYMYSIMFCCVIFFWEVPQNKRRSQKWLVSLFKLYRFAVVVGAMMQYPLHLYNVFALRSANQNLLTGDPENSWGFGQIVALVMVGQVLVECCRGVREYHKDSNKVDEDVASNRDPEG